MIDRTNIHKLFYKIDILLKQRGEKRHFIIFGSSALIMQKICHKNRSTMDIDLIEPKMDVTLQNIAIEIGEEYGMGMQWLNSSGSIFQYNFPSHWKNRIKQVFKGQALTVNTLGKKDLIAVKFYSYYERNLQTDKDDLIALQPSKEEINFSKRWLLSLKNVDKQVIHSQFEEILRLIKNKDS